MPTKKKTVVKKSEPEKKSNDVDQKVEKRKAPVAENKIKRKKEAGKIVVVLESAGIAITDIGKRKNQVLSHDKDGNFLDAKGQPTWLFRPDIVHQALLAIYDMPLCKEGHVQVYINTIKQKAIEVSPTTRIPRTFKRFAGLISQLIDQGKVVNPETDQPLFKVLNYPVRQLVPENAQVYGLCNTESLTPRNPYDLVEEIDSTHKGRGPVAYFVVQCRDNAVWPDDEEGFGDYVTNRVCITQYEVCFSFHMMLFILNIINCFK